MIQPAELITVLDAILEGIQVLGSDWRYLHVNDAAARHGRSTPKALLGRTIQECYPGIEGTPVFELMRQAMVERTSHSLENEFDFPDGSIGYFELRIEPIPQGICVLSIDITERRIAEHARAQAEERLQHAQRMEAIGHLAAGIAHDFNNLLTVILGQCDIAIRRPEGPSHDDLEPLRQAAMSAADLTRQLLAFGRRSVLSREVVDLPEVVRGLETLLCRTLESRIDLVIDTSAQVGRVQVDRTQFEQLLMNLIVNARDAIDGSGRITIAISNTELGPDHVEAHPGSRVGPHVVLAVTDTGIGMDAATRARIFEPFFTTKDRGRGTGLGLASVYGIVKQHGGTVWVYSEPGSGTCFKVYLPCTDLPMSPGPSPQTPVETGTKTVAKILVVDDMPEIGRLAARILSLDSHEVLVAGSGDEAVTIWAQHGDSIGLVITDLMMPGMSSAELIKRIRVSRPDLPVLCMSGYNDAHVARAGTLPQCSSFLEKPFTPAQLLSRVQAMLASRAR